MNFFYQSRVESFSSFVSNDNTYPAHLHQQVEFMFVIYGELTLSIENTQYSLSKGDLSITFPDQIHSIHTPSNSRVLFIVFDIDYLQEFRKSFSDFIPTDPILHVSQLNEHGKNALSWLISLSKNRNATADIPYKKETIPSSSQSENGDLVSNDIYSRCYLTILLADVFSVLSLQKRNTSSDKNICEHILIYLDQHFQEDISLESSAKALGISKFYLSQIFSNKLHTSFPTYVTARRLDYAEKLLSTTNLPVADIAKESGFTSPRTFFRSFQTVYHVTPHQYRKNKIDQNRYKKGETK